MSITNNEFDSIQYEKYNKEIKKIVISLENNSSVKNINIIELENLFRNIDKNSLNISTDTAFHITETYHSLDNIINQNKLHYNKNISQKMKWETLYESFKAVLSLFKKVQFSCINLLSDLNHFSVSYYINAEAIYLESCPPSTV